MNIVSRLKALGCFVVLFAFTTVLHAQDSGWEVNPNDYRYDMSAYVLLSGDEGSVTDYSDYEIGAFVGDECRGVAEVSTQDGYTWLYLRIRSNVASGETVNFRVYEKSTQKTYRVTESIDFKSDDQVGMPSSPQSLSLKKYTLGDVNDDGEIDVLDAMLVVDKIIGKDTQNAIEEAMDMDGDGTIDVGDAILIVNIIIGKE